MAEQTEFDRSVERQSYDSLPRHPLIICASLVQNPANLGALCRTVEAFRLVSLVLADQAIVQTSPFRNLAASTHYWQPIEICPIAQLSEWIVQQRQMGYSPIALDTQPTAIPLTQFAFPQTTILILGQELTGIPEAVLAQCDRAVTIPQYGLVESLNVQTAAAIAIYQYVQQWGMERSKAAKLLEQPITERSDEKD
ncbi:MAG TPA: RNA methyltransferase [Trichocoleus sp.]|jgi:tRNA guanosine-2'-O-methyltransferase